MAEEETLVEEGQGPSITKIEEKEEGEDGGKASDKVDAPGATTEALPRKVGAQKIAKRLSKRMSMSLNVAGGMGKRTSIASSMTGISAAKVPGLRLQPNYRIEPKAKFDSERVTRIIQETVFRRMANYTYNSKLASQTMKTLAEELKAKVKEQGFDRYKVVSVVSLVEKKGQGVMESSRCVWDPRWDTYAQFVHETPNIICIAMVFGVFRE